MTRWVNFRKKKLYEHELKLSDYNIKSTKFRVGANMETGPKGYKTFSCSTQLSTRFQLLIKIQIPTKEKFLVLNVLDVVFIMLINGKLPTIVGILTFMSRINFVLS